MSLHSLVANLKKGRSDQNGLICVHWSALEIWQPAWRMRSAMPSVLTGSLSWKKGKASWTLTTTTALGLSIDHGSSTDWSGYHLAGGKWHSDLWSCQPGGWSAPWSGLAAFDFDAYTDGLSRLCATDDLGLQFFGQDNLNWQFLHACFCLHNSFNGFGAFKVCLTLWVPKTALLEIWLMLLHELQPKLATSGHACHPRHLLTRTDVSWPQLSNGLKLGSHGFGLDYCHGSGNIAGCIPL